MCIEVKYKGIWIDNVKEFRKSIDCEIIKDKCYKNLPKDEDCLCGLDIEKMLEKKNLKFEKDEMQNYLIESLKNGL